MPDLKKPTDHHMGRRSSVNDYSLPGMYHITLRVAEGLGHPFGRVVGDANMPDGSPLAPHVELSVVGRMVEHELLNSIRKYYRMVEVQDYVVMPEHLHFIVEVHEAIVSQNGRKAHLGQVVAGFKKGCNRGYWAITGQQDAGNWRGKPASANDAAARGGAVNGGANGAVNGGAVNGGVVNGGANGAVNGGAVVSRPAVFPLGYEVPSRASTGRPVLFAEGYVDVMPLRGGQLAQQREYIRNNPRSRLLRSQHRDVLQAQRGGIDTALSIDALVGYLRDVCAAWQVTPEKTASIVERLLTTGATRRGKPAGANASSGAENANANANGGAESANANGGAMIDCDSYGYRALLGRRLLPVVCHRRDKALFGQQKERCLRAAQSGAVLVSARISPGEQEIMNAAIADGQPVVLLIDNGMPELYHPSAERMALCLADKLLLVTPWKYKYRPASVGISVAECKAMNRVVLALCRLNDDWWR